MAFGSMSESDGDEPLAEINMIPLIDVMLVLLVIFIVTAPLLTHSVAVDLPKASSAPTLSKPETLEVAIDAQSRYHLNGAPIAAEALSAALAAAAGKTPPPELHLRAERSTPYEKVAQLMSEASRVGITRIGFVTEPTAAH